MLLVTGANGLVGREVATRLQGRATLRLDFLDPSSFEAALRGVDRVSLLRPPQLARARRDLGPFIAAMERAGVAYGVFLSMRGAGGNPWLVRQLGAPTPIGAASP